MHEMEVQLGLYQVEGRCSKASTLDLTCFNADDNVGRLCWASSPDPSLTDT